ISPGTARPSQSGISSPSSRQTSSTTKISRLNSGSMTAMKIGLSRPFADPGHPVPDIDMGEVCRIAEDAGFDWVTYGHHTIRPLDEPVVPPHFGVPLYQDPLIGAARALALTTRLEVSTGVLIMPMQHPVILAKQVPTVDRYGCGRFALCLGAGGASRLAIELTGGTFNG